MNSISNIETKIKIIVEDLHLVFVNIKSYELLVSEEGSNTSMLSPSFVNSYLYSSMNTNVLIVANLFDSNKKVLSLDKLVNIIERNKTQILKNLNLIESSKLNCPLTKDIDLKNDIEEWRKRIVSLRGEITKKIFVIRHKVCAHINNSFSEEQIKENSFLIDDFKQLVNNVFELLNDIRSSVFHSGYAINKCNDGDLSKILKIVNESFDKI